MDILTRNNIFILPDADSGTNLIYMPFANYAAALSDKQVQELCNVLGGETEISSAAVNDVLQHRNNAPRKIWHTSHRADDLLNLMILPNNRCNLHCTYCYSAHGRTNSEITIETLRCGLRHFLSPDRIAGKRVTISVLGGGEPLLSWNIVKQGLEYAYELTSLREEPLPVSIVTNGTIVNDEIIGFCLEHNISLSVSFDILKDIQNRQRGEYDKICANVNRFAASGLDLAFNTVITKDNVCRMAEMIECMKQNNGNIRKISFKPIISNTYFADDEQRRDYYKKFVDNFFNAQTLAEQYGIWLTSTYQNAILCLADRYCPGKFAITSDGEVSICHCVSSKRDIHYDEFIFGRIDTEEDKVYIDEEKLHNILSYDMNRHDRCADCPAKWHCAGGCYADGCHLTDNEHAVYCESMRYFLLKYLKKRFNL